MKKFIFQSLFSIALIVFSFSCASRPKVEVVDNTFETKIINNSHFVVSVEGEEIAPANSILHKFPLHDSAMYDGQKFLYKIPVTDKIFYEKTEKIQIVNNQKELKLKNPVSNDRESYIVIKNNSDSSLQLSNGIGTYFSCVTNGCVNSLDCQKDMYIKANASVACEILGKTHLFLETKKEKYDLLGKIKRLDGYIYTFVFDGTFVTLQDARPLVKIGENSWSVRLEPKSSVQKIISSENGDSFFYINNFVGENKNGAAFRMAEIVCLKNDGSEKWRTRLEIQNGNVFLYDIKTCDENIFSVGQNEATAFSALYSSEGKQLDFVEFDSAYTFDSAVKCDKNAFLIIGMTEKNPVIVKAFVEKNKIRYENIPVKSEKFDSSIAQTVPFYDENEKLTYFFCNRQNEEGETLPTVAYRLEKDGSLLEIPLKDSIQFVSSVCKCGDSILIAGESVSETNSSALILKLNLSQNETQIFFQDKNPYSYISAMKTNEIFDDLVIAGAYGAKESSGLGGTAFLIGLNKTTGKEIWNSEYKDANLILEFVPCKDYGFVGVFADIKDDSVKTKKIIRANATGKYK